MEIKFCRVRDVDMPERANVNDSGMDFFVPNDLRDIVEDTKFTPMEGLNQIEMREKFVDLDNEQIIVPAGYGIMMPSGIKVILPTSGGDATHELSWFAKSGLFVKHHIMAGAQIVDNGYQGEVFINFVNNGFDPFVLTPGQKVIQGIIREVKLPKIREIEETEFDGWQKTQRGDGAFGSTGI